MLSRLKIQTLDQGLYSGQTFMNLQLPGGGVVTCFALLSFHMEKRAPRQYESARPPFKHTAAEKRRKSGGRMLRTVLGREEGLAERA